MRTTGAVLAALLAGPLLTAAHPLCFVDDRPTDPNQVLSFCPAAQDGACCTDQEEAEVQARFDAAGPLTGDCEDLYKQVECGQCHSFSAHLFERLGAELGVADGMTMKSEFCEELVSACSGQIDFPTYDGGVGYCDKHTGGGEDFFWSYPYEEPEIFETGLTQQVFPDLDSESEFPAQTVSMHQSPDGSMYWILGQAGEVKVVDSSNLGSISTVVDISGGEFYLEYEEGLLDFAFGPMFGVSGFPNYFYLSYTCQLDDGTNPRNRLSKFEYIAGDPDATRASEEILITTTSKETSIHSGGWCGFKPSDYGSNTAASHDLFWAIGDGGPQTDPSNTGQDTANLLGSIVRISVPSDGTGYTIPSGNLESPALPEICANGFRNPWRCGFDRETDELYCGDVGHTNVEEIDIVQCGHNYGWSRFEGSRCQEAMEERDGSCAGASRSDFTFPIFEYCHPDYYSDAAEEADFTDGVDICGDRMLTGFSVIGGHVYRGTFFGDLLYGAYIFGDNTNKNVYFIKEEDDGEWSVGTIISDASVPIVSFSEDKDGELLLVSRDYNIYQMPCGDLCSSTCLDQVSAADQPSYESLGCFADVEDDHAMEIDASNQCDEGGQSMSPKICAAYCATIDGATYAGVQYGYECFCGTADTDYARHGSLSSSSCDVMCTASPGEFCGGYLAMEVFALGDAAATTFPVTTPPETVPPATTIPVTTPPVTSPPSTEPPGTSSSGSGGPSGTITYIGCFADSSEGRIFTGEQFTSADMTSEVCADLCLDSAFFGTQFANECWCGDSESNTAFNNDFMVYGEGVCDMVCSGDSDGVVVEICGGLDSVSVYANFDNVGLA